MNEINNTVHFASGTMEEFEAKDIPLHVTAKNGVRFDSITVDEFPRLEFRATGETLYNGRILTTDPEIAEGMREFLADTNYTAMKKEYVRLQEENTRLKAELARLKECIGGPI